MTNTIAKAEQLARARVVLFYLMAAAFVVSAIIGLGAHATIDRTILWVCVGMLTAANLTPLAGWLRPNAVNRLVNDETTRDHRRTSYAAGFWASLVVALGLAILVRAVPMSPEYVARWVVTAALTTALVVFATLEARALRNG
jgi:uncharacterized membrane protein YoaK (UPF0700 family)